MINRGSHAPVVTINRPDVIALIEAAAISDGSNKTEAGAGDARLLEQNARTGSLFGAHPDRSGSATALT